jgi:hypothetical protein
MANSDFAKLASGRRPDEALAKSGRDAGNRTRSPRTRSVCTTGILHPESPNHYNDILKIYQYYSSSDLKLAILSSSL